jgi:hypothetical protein
MVWKTSAANFGLNDIPGLCVCTLYTDLIVQSIFLCQSICLPANARFIALKLYYEEVNFHYILNFFIWMCFTLL